MQEKIMPDEAREALFRTTFGPYEVDFDASTARIEAQLKKQGTYKDVRVNQQAQNQSSSKS
jgi:hypothetical protein